MNKHIHRLSFVFAAMMALALSFVACGGGGGGNNNPDPGPITVPVTGVTLSQSSMSLTVGGAAGSLTATVSPSNATNKNVTWTVSPATGVVTLAGSGTARTVTAVAAGSATVTVKSDADPSKTATCAVTVTGGSSGLEGDWKTVSAGGAHTIALRTDGSLWVWGYNNYGQLGLGDTNDRNAPTRVGTDTNWAVVSAGRYHTLALKTDGSLWAWGYNNRGQLGNGDSYDRNVPTRVGADAIWATVSAGTWHTLAIKTDGSLWAWGGGDQDFGQLGNGYNRNTPTRVGTDTRWKAVLTGWAHTLAIKSDDSLWAWGYNYCGQLGLGYAWTSGWDPQYWTPQRVGADTNWKAVCADDRYTLALKTDGSLWAWGEGGVALGLGSNQYNMYVTPTRVGTDVNWATVSTGYHHTIAIKTDGSLWAWGVNGYGQLGLGDYGDAKYRNTPTRVGADTNWAAVSAGDSHTLAIKTNGSLWAWGNNNYGRLGLGTTDNYAHPTPTRVGGSSGQAAAPVDGDL